MKKMREEVSWPALNGVRLWAGGRPGVLLCGSPCRSHLPAAAGPFPLTCTPLCLGVCFGGLRGCSVAAVRTLKDSTGGGLTA